MSWVECIMRPYLIGPGIGVILQWALQQCMGSLPDLFTAIHPATSNVTAPLCSRLCKTCWKCYNTVMAVACLRAAAAVVSSHC
jgi:hypothetical protein